MFVHILIAFLISCQLTTFTTDDNKPIFDFNHKDFKAKQDKLHDEEIQFLRDFVSAIDERNHKLAVWFSILPKCKKFPQTVVIENIRFFNRDKLDAWLDKSFDEGAYKDFVGYLQPNKEKLKSIRFYFSLLNQEEYGMAQLSAQSLKEAGKVGNVEEPDQKRFILRRPGLFGLD